MERVPLDVQTQILFYMQQGSSNLHFVNRAYRQSYIDSLEQIGLYGKSLILEGFKQLEKKHRLLKECNAEILNLAKPKTKKNPIICFFKREVPPSDPFARFDKEFQNIDRTLNQLREMRCVEKFIYELVGGESKFHQLPVLRLNPANRQFWSIGCSSIYLNKLPAGQVLMRGLTPPSECCFLADCPFIAISYIDQQVSNYVKTAVFHQCFSTVAYKWNCAGNGPPLLGNYGDLNSFMYRSGEERKALEIPLKQLLTTGSCQADPNDPGKGMIMLKGQIKSVLT